MLVLRDRQGLSSHVALVPPGVAVLLSLCDGTRDLRAIRIAYELRTGESMTPAQLDGIIAQLDSALMLESPRLAAASAAALEDYRSAPARKPSLAGQVYPEDPVACHEALSSYGVGLDGSPSTTVDGVRGIVCPHIDYHRGGPVYARVWASAAQAARQAEVIVVFGTDHAGGAERLTLTRQRYATPFGSLPTAVDVVDEVSRAIGEDVAFADELNHRTEHSVELAVVWLHHVLGDSSRQIVPILCGSFHRLVDGTASATDGPLEAAVAALQKALAGRRTLVVAAADLAHVGPTFGDERPFGMAEREELARVDSRLLEAACIGDAAGLLAAVAADSDRWRVCGLPPIYLALRFLGESAGFVAGYDQCPADEEGGSWVSVAGIVLR